MPFTSRTTIPENAYDIISLLQVPQSKSRSLIECLVVLAVLYTLTVVGTCSLIFVTRSMHNVVQYTSQYTLE